MASSMENMLSISKMAKSITSTILKLDLKMVNGYGTMRKEIL